MQALIFVTGFRKPLSQINHKHINGIIQLLIDYFCMMKVKAAIDQYTEGLQDLGILTCIQQNPSEWKKFFLQDKIELSAGKYDILFTTMWFTVSKCYNENYGCAGFDTENYGIPLPPLNFLHTSKRIMTKNRNYNVRFIKNNCTYFRITRQASMLIRKK